MKNSLNSPINNHLSPIKISNCSENIKGDEPMIHLINSLNSIIKKFYKNMKEQIKRGKNNNNEISLIKENYENMNETLNNFIYNAKDIFQNLKLTRRKRIIENELQISSYNNKVNLLSRSYSKISCLRKNFLGISSPKIENTSISPRNIDDLNNRFVKKKKVSQENNIYLHDDIQILVDEIVKFLNEINLVKDKIFNMSEELQNERKKILKYIDDLDSLIHKISPLNNKSKTIEYEKRNYESLLKEKIDLIGKLNQEIQSKNEIIEKSNSQILHLKSINDKKLKELNENKKQYKEVINLLYNLKEEKCSKNGNEKKKKDESHLLKLSDDINKLNEKIKLQNQELIEKNNIISQFQSDNSKLTMKVSKHINEKNNLLKEIEKLKKLNKKKTKLSEFENNLNMKEKTIEILNQNLNYKNNKINELTINNNNLLNKIEKLNLDIISLKKIKFNEEEFLQLKNEKINYQKTLLHLKNEITNIKEKKEKLLVIFKEQIKFFEEEIIKTKENMNNKIKVFEDNNLSDIHQVKVNSTINKYQNKIFSLENELSKLKEDNISKIISPIQYNIIIDKKINMPNNITLHWYLMTEKKSENKNYNNTFWVKESEINNLFEYNKFKSEDEIENENIEKIIKMQQKFIDKIQKKDDEIDSLKSENKKQKMNLSNNSNLKNKNELFKYNSNEQKFDSLSDKIIPYKQYEKAINELSELNVKLQKSSNYILKLKSSYGLKLGFIDDNFDLSFINKNEENKSEFFDNEIKEVIDFENEEVLNSKNELENKLCQLKSLFKLIIHELQISSKIKKIVINACLILGFDNEEINRMFEEKNKKNKILGIFKKNG